MDRYVIEMAALGRLFHVGDLYNYRNDSILPLLDKGLSRDSIHSKVSSEIISKIQVESFCHDSGLSYEKWDRLGIDDHLRASIAVGVIDEFSGSSRYLTDRYKPGQATRTVVLRMESFKDLHHTVDQEDVAGLRGFNQATHLIVGVVYGAQGYCVVTHDLSNVEEEEAEEYLSKITSKIEKALKDNRDVDEFVEQFDVSEAEHLTARVKCRLYVDFHSVREYCVFEAYEHCLHFVRHIQKPEFQNSKENAIAAVLCPLKFVVPSAGTLGEYRDVDAELVMQYSRIADSLNRAMAMADAARTTGSRAQRVPLRQFHDAVAEYQGKLQKILKNEILKARANTNSNDHEIERIVHIAQRHPLFKPSRLEQWLRFKQSESEVIEKIANMKGVALFADRIRLERELADTFVQNFALVLIIPPVDGETNAILKGMREYVSKPMELTPDVSDEDEDEEGLPWHMTQRKRKQVLDKIREFANHVEKNKHLKDGLQFSITFGHPGQGHCYYSVYEADNLLEDNLIALPHPPTDLRINYLTKDNAIDLNTSVVRVSWNYTDTGYPHHFIVEYRPKGSCDKSWMQRKTTVPGENQTIISLPTGSAIEIRVAADTCIGRSDFTNVIDTGSVCHDDLHADGAHDPIPIKDNAVWNYPSYAKLLFSIYSRCRPPSDNRRIAETFALEKSVLIHRGQPNIHLLNVKENSIDSDFRWMDVGPSHSVSTAPFNRRDHKIIMLMGATGSGKSTLIDGMMNYILGVQWSDPFRFKCVRQTHSRTSSVTAYTIRHRDGMCIPYSITIIDTPGYSKDTGKTNHSRKIERFLTHRNIRIDQIHAVCFVAASNDIESAMMQPYVLDSVLSLFGKEVKDNIRLLITFADMVHPPVVDTCSSATFPFTSSSGLSYNQFDNSVLFASNEEEDDVCFDQLFWRMDQENYGAFFSHLEKTNAKHLGSTRDVIQRRLLLNQSLREIERGLEVYLVNAENVRMFRRKIKEYGDKMEANKDFLVEQTDVRLLKVKCNKGYVCYNCRRCRRTCEGPVRSIRFVYIRGIKKKQCTHICCPCPATEHEYQSFQWRHVTQNVVTTDEEMKAAYESYANDKLTIEQLLEHCQNELKMIKAKLFCLLARVGSSCLLLEATALRADTLSLADYLSLMRSRVAEELAPGYVTRLEILNELQQSLAGDVRPTDTSPAIRDGIQIVGCDEPYQLKFVDKFAID